MHALLIIILLRSGLGRSSYRQAVDRDTVEISVRKRCLERQAVLATFVVADSALRNA